MLIIGVDSGGTKTEAVLIGDDGLMAEALAGPSNPASVGIDIACSNIKEALGKLGGVEPDAVGLGVAGLVDARLASELGRCLGLRNPVFFEDIEAAHVSAFLFGEGVVGVLGTGSSFLGVKGSAKIRIGGWGHLLGDEGGAYHIGREAIRMALREAEQMEERGCLADDVFRFYGAGGVGELLYVIYSSSSPRNKIAEYAPRVFALARSCRDALEVVRSAADSVAEYIATVFRRLGRLPVALTGSVYLNNEEVLRPMIESALARLGYRVEIKRPLVRQSCAAALIAARALGLLDERLIERVRETCVLK